MSPAGYWPQLKAAIEAGADAVYFGVQHFSARAKVGFRLDELPEALATLRGRGVKGYVTFNTLVFDYEIGEACRVLAAIARSGADAIIVQDLGAASLARKVAPTLPVHGSTQMSITSTEGIRIAQSLGVTRVVLARELSLEDIRQIRAQTDCELEMFVHGALCVSYSGQCFSSEAWGGRSANRGQCAQACRLPYEMLVDGVVKPLGDARYLLSPGDLYALRQIPEIVGIGVSAVKIEGRYKGADYVALTTAAYRKAVDEAWEGRALTFTRSGEAVLEQVYSRGMGPWFITGTNHQAVVRGRSPRHRGLLAGRITRVRDDAVEIAPAEGVSLKPGDGVVFDAADWRSPQEPEEGGRVYAVTPVRNDAFAIGFGNEAVNFRRLRPGDLVWRTHDPEVDRAAKRFLDPLVLVHRRKLHVHVRARAGEPLVSEWRVEQPTAEPVTVWSPEPLPTASTHALSEQLLREQLGRLGNTPFALGGLQASIEGAPFAPVSLLNQIRRQAVAELSEIARRPRPAEVADPGALTIEALRLPPATAVTGSPRIHLLVRFPEQLDAAIELRPASITLDYLDLYGLRPSVDRVRDAGIAVRVASPRVLKPGEERIVTFLHKLACPILVRSTGLLETLRQQEHPEITGDFSLNAANAITARLLLDLGLTRLTPTHDLNADQVAKLAVALGPDLIEAVAYHHLPVFHTEHCVFCRFLSRGTSHKDCGRPCEKHRVALRDQQGRPHPVIADAGCRNTVFGAEAQEASRHLPEWLDAGLRHFRLEFVHESPEEIVRVTRAFERALDGSLSSRELAEEWRRVSPHGVTEGSLFVPAGYATLPILQ